MNDVLSSPLQATTVSSRDALRLADTDVLLIGIMCVGSLIPSLSTGASVMELGAFAAVFGAGGLCLWRMERSAAFALPIRVYGFMATWTVLCLFHTDRYEYFRNASGVFFWGCSMVIGASLSQDNRNQVGGLLFWLVCAAVCRDILLDVTGWSQADSFAQNTRWRPGVRGLATSRSIFPTLLACFAGARYFHGQGRERPLAVGLLVVGFWAVAVMGQGRGATLLFLVALFLGCRTHRQRSMCLGVGLAVGVIVLIFAMTAMTDNPFLGPLVGRFAEIAEEGEVDRLEQSSFALEAVVNNGLEVLLIGISPKRVSLELDLGGVHNAYWDMTLRYGIPCGLLFLTFWMLLVGQSVKSYIQAGPLPFWLTAIRVYVLVTAVGMLEAGIFWDWRATIIPGVMLGIFIGHAQDTTSSKPSLSIRSVS